MVSIVDYGSDDSSINNGCQRKRKGSKNNADLISSLTDDVLIKILSLLDPKEAVRTSVLSQRWRHLWAGLPDMYNFDTSGMLWPMLKSYDDNQYYTELHKFIGYVNQVLVSSSRSTRTSIDRFMVRCSLDINHREDVQTWVDLAMEKGVKELELCLTRLIGVSLRSPPVYLDPFGRYAQSPSAKTLVSLSLTALKIDYSFLISVLFNLPNLERLALRGSYCGFGSYISIVGPSLKLRHLEISYCNGLKGISISATKLHSFVFGGHDVDIDFKSVPLLSEVSFSGTYVTRLIHNFRYMLGCSSQLTKLTLTINYNGKGIFDSSVEFPCFQKLKQLELTISCGPDQSLLVITNLIDACPVLHKFKLHRNVHDFANLRYFGMPVTNVDSSVDRVSRKLHQGLSIFEMVGFMGCEADNELILYLSRFAILLERVILHPRQKKNFWDIYRRR